MKLGIIFFFVLVIGTSVALADEDILMQTISIKADSIKKADLLDSLGVKYNLHFSYNPQALEAQKHISIIAENLLLIEVLYRLIPDNSLAIRTVDNQVIFYPTRELPDTTASIKKIRIAGQITGQNGIQPIPYCHITLVGKALGTISNTQGKFSVLIPDSLANDTLAFSCLGYDTKYLPIAQTDSLPLNIKLQTHIFKLQTINITRYNPEDILRNYDQNYKRNYETEYTLFEAFYREITIENNHYTNISEAVLNILKAPYHNEFRNDLVKFVKGRKGTETSPIGDIRLTLMGGPFYITKLDVVKNKESFLDAENRKFYTYKFDRTTLMNNRKTAVVEFSPIYTLRNILFEGTLYFDIETWGIARVEFRYTRQGLREARQTLIYKKPRHVKVDPDKLEYAVQYKYIDSKWYLQSARSFFDIKINNRETREKTNFSSTSEILTTSIEKGSFEKFARHDIFRPNEIFTERISTYDPTFWGNYNVITPEDELTNALKNFEEKNLVVTYSH